MNSLRFPILILGIILLAVSCGSQDLADKQAVSFPKIEDLKTITVGGEQLRVEVADTDEERAQGLSGRISLLATQGMLFDFTNSTERRPEFWMKDMKFDIDIIWIEDNEVIGVTEKVPPPTSETYLPTYRAPRQIDYVLEVNGGWADQHNIVEGTPVQL